jgi:hypothetical protein
MENLAIVGVAISSIAAIAAIANVAERIYSRFYPEPDTQKKHFKTVLSWALIIVALATQIWIIVDLFWDPFPTTSPKLAFFVLRACFATAFIFFAVLGQVVLYFLGRMLDVNAGMIGIQGDVINILRVHKDSLTMLLNVSDLPRQDAELLTKALEAGQL